MLSKYKDIVMPKIIDYEFELKEFSWGRMVMSSTERIRMVWLIRKDFPSLFECVLLNGIYHFKGVYFRLVDVK